MVAKKAALGYALPMLFLSLLLACAPSDSDSSSEIIYSSGDCSKTPRLEYPGMSLWQFEVCYVEDADGICVQEFPSRKGSEILYNCDPNLVEIWTLIEIPAL